MALGTGARNHSLNPIQIDGKRGPAIKVDENLGLIQTKAGAG
jgi:hypothetical protein